MVSTHKSLCTRIKRGFTLIELMVATAIMAMLIMAVMGITSHVLSSWNSASGRLGANAEARIALQHLGDDLETLVVRPKAQVWMEVKNTNVTIGDKVASMPNITLITATENRPDVKDSYGNICAVNYAIDFNHPVTGDKDPYKVAGLYRKVISPEDTFTKILPETLVGPDDEGNIVFPSLAQVTSGVGGNTVSFSNFLNSNIVDLSVDFYAEVYKNSSGVRTLVKPRPVLSDKAEGKGFLYSDKVTDLGGNALIPTSTEDDDLDSGGTLEFGRILYADIRMTVLSDEGAKLLRSGTETVDTAEIAKNYGTIFSRRVPILSRY